MANLICTADGNLTAAATWATPDATALVEPTLLGSTALTVGNLDSAAFIPGAITVDGVAVKLASRAAGTPTNTMTISLVDTTAVVVKGTVTVNVSDLAACSTADQAGGWYFFKFAAPVLLTAGNNHVVRATLSATTTAVSLYTNNTANNWLHILRTTTTAAPVAGDNMHVMGEFNGAVNPATTSTHTVTMDQTVATNYGSNFVPGSGDKSSGALQIGNRGTVTYATTAATNFLLQLAGNVNVFSGGSLIIGATGAEIPRGSTATLQLNCTTAGDFGLLVRSGGTLTTAGLSRTLAKNQYRCKLNADAAAAATVLNVDTDTGWLSGDDIGLAPTAQTSGQFERRTLSVNASATQLTVTAGLTNAHLGSGDYFAEVVLLTRNVTIQAVSSASRSSFLYAGPTSTVSCLWTSFRYFSNQNSGINQQFRIETTTGSYLTRFCVYQDFDAGITANGAAHGGWTIDQCVFYNQRSGAGNFARVLVIPLTTGTWTLTDFWIIGSGTAATPAGISFDDFGGTIGNLSVSGCFTDAIYVTEATNEGTNGPTFPANTTWAVHSNNGCGIRFNNHFRNITFPTTQVWRNVNRGIWLSSTFYFDNIEFNGGFWLGNGPGTGTEEPQFWIQGTNPVNDLRFRNLIIGSDSSFISHWGVLFDQGRISAQNIQWFDCTFSDSTGIRRPVTVADIGCIADTTPGTTCVTGIAMNCSFGSSGVPVSFFYAAGTSPTVNSKYSAIRCPMFGKSATAHRTYTPRGTFLIEQVTVDVAPSLQIQPLGGLAVPVDSNVFQPGWGFLVPVKSGQTVTVSVKVQTNAGYNGSTQPQLVQLANEQVGVTVDTVLATMPAGSGVWNTLTATTAVATADGVIEFVVRVYGNTGAAFVDTWTAL